MWFNVNIRHGLEVAEPSILDNPEYRHKCIEHQAIHPPRLVRLRNKNAEKGIKDVVQKLDDFTFSNKGELAEYSREKFLVQYLLPLEKAEQHQVLSNFGKRG